MVITEIFPNPTVKQVIFQLRFPNLFFLENKIGDFQMRIMKDYPKSELTYRRNIVFADLGPKGTFKPLDEDIGQKIWEFQSANESSKVSVSTNALTIISEHYKTYNLDGADKFRDAIKSAVDNFLEVMAIPIFARIGLRYIDECPIPAMNNEQFKSWYNSTFPIERFNMSDTTEMLFKTVVRRGTLNLRYIEALQKNEKGYKLILDFDGFAKDVPSKDFLNIADEMHTLISAEYEKTIKAPVYEYMRKEVQ